MARLAVTTSDIDGVGAIAIVDHAMTSGVASCSLSGRKTISRHQLMQARGIGGAVFAGRKLQQKSSLLFLCVVTRRHEHGAKLVKAQNYRTDSKGAPEEAA